MNKEELETVEDNKRNIIYQELEQIGEGDIIKGVTNLFKTIEDFKIFIMIRKKEYLQEIERIIHELEKKDLIYKMKYIDKDNIIVGINIYGDRITEITTNGVMFYNNTCYNTEYLKSIIDMMNILQLLERFNNK